MSLAADYSAAKRYDLLRKDQSYETRVPFGTRVVLYSQNSKEFYLRSVFETAKCRRNGVLLFTNPY